MEKQGTRNVNKRIAILVMMAPGCEAGRGRVFEAIAENAPGVDTFASLDGVKVELPSWVSALHPPAGTKGIVRPTKWCVAQLAGRYEWLLRLTWDAELVATPEAVVSPCGYVIGEKVVYGTVRMGNKDTLTGIIRRMGGPTPTDFNYVDGFAMLARMLWWSQIFSALPKEVTHYKDDSVSSVYGMMKGWPLENRRLAIHRHMEWRK